MAASLEHRVAVYTGVFDPVHFGHLDVIRRGSKIFERLVVGVGINPDKSSFFTLEERVELVKRVVADLPNVQVFPFEDLAVRFVRSVGARIMLRGLRTLSDMEYEFSMSLTNLVLDPELETVFLMSNEIYSHVSSTLIRQIASLHGELEKFVPPQVKEALQARVREREQKAGTAVPTKSETRAKSDKSLKRERKEV
jgi:pantetheine-phosphate adenylyltransferase